MPDKSYIEICRKVRNKNIGIFDFACVPLSLSTSISPDCGAAGLVFGSIAGAAILSDSSEGADKSGIGKRKGNGPINENGDFRSGIGKRNGLGPIVVTVE